MANQKVDKFQDQVNWPSYLGRAVVKHSGKPFKSGEKRGVPQSMTINPYTSKEAFLMDDGSVVDCFQCKLAS